MPRSYTDQRSGTHEVQNSALGLCSEISLFTWRFLLRHFKTVPYPVFTPIWCEDTWNDWRYSDRKVPLLLDQHRAGWVTTRFAKAATSLNSLPLTIKASSASLTHKSDKTKTVNSSEIIKTWKHDIFFLFFCVGKEINNFQESKGFRLICPI